MSESTSSAVPRNLTLDFFRGAALLIIFINHVPANELLLYTPTRFGLSDAAEMFVFLSGCAAALAYGKTFRSAGFALGSARVCHRCAQIYAAHLTLFGLLAITCVIGNGLLDTRDYITHLNIRYLFDHTEEALRQLITLRYVPNYFDILPMYLVVMLWIPAVLALAQVHRYLAVALPVGVYLAMWVFDLEFLADPVGDRPWFFNPFGWQLIFFIGFAFGARWLRCPPARSWLIVSSVAIVLLSVPLSPEPAMRPTPFLQQWHADLQPWLEKTRFGPLRLMHFLALAYLASVVMSGRERWLDSRPARLLVKAGQQSLPIFMLSMVLSYVGGMVFDQFGHGAVTIAVINASGLAILLGSGALMAWLKASPWRRPERDMIRSEGAMRLAGAFSWRQRLETGAALALVVLVAVGPVLLTVRRSSIVAVPSTVILTGTAWQTAQLSDERVAEAVPGPEAD